MKKSALSRLQALLPQPRKKVRKLAANAARQLTAPPYEDYEGESTTRLSTAFGVVLMLHLVAVGGVYAFHQIKKSRSAAAVAATPDLMSEIKRTGPTAAVPQKVGVAPLAPGTGAGSGLPSAGAPKVTQGPGSASAPVAPVSATASTSPAAQAAAGLAVAPRVPAVAATGGRSSAGVKSDATSPSAVVAAAKVPATAAVVALPVSVSGASSVASGAPGAEGSASSLKSHTVQKGENPVTIAKKYGVSQEELLKLNAIEDPRKLRIGQVLRVPAKK